MTANDELIGLGYIGIRSDRLDDWSTYATRLLGMQQVDRAGGVRAYRMDDRKQRLIVTNEGVDKAARASVTTLVWPLGWKRMGDRSTVPRAPWRRNGMSPT